MMPDNIRLALDNTQTNALRAAFVLAERPFTTWLPKWSMKNRHRGQFKTFGMRASRQKLSIHRMSRDLRGWATLEMVLKTRTCPGLAGHKAIISKRAVR